MNLPPGHWLVVRGFIPRPGARILRACLDVAPPCLDRDTDPAPSPADL